MALSEADVEQFIAALHENPQLKDRVRNAILADDFLALPGIVARLGDRTDVVAQQLGELTQRVDELTQRVDQLTQRVDQLTQRVDQLTQRVDELTQRVDQLTQRVDELTQRVDQLTLRMDQLTQQVQALTEEMRMVNARLARVEGRLGNVEGSQFEFRYVQNLGANLAPYLRKAAAVTAADVDILTQAFQRGEISRDDWREVHRLDILVRGQTYESPPRESWFAIELSSIVDTGDVERAANRAALLRRFGLDVEAAVDGEQVLDAAVARAAELGVRLLVERSTAAA